jgi:hypothetical protein
MSTLTINPRPVQPVIQATSSRPQTRSNETSRTTQRPDTQERTSFLTALLRALAASAV